MMDDVAVSLKNDRRLQDTNNNLFALKPLSQQKSSAVLRWRGIQQRIH